MHSEPIRMRTRLKKEYSYCARQSIARLAASLQLFVMAASGRTETDNNRLSARTSERFGHPLHRASTFPIAQCAVTTDRCSTSAFDVAVLPDDEFLSSGTFAVASASLALYDASASRFATCFAVRRLCTTAFASSAITWYNTTSLAFNPVGEMFVLAEWTRGGRTRVGSAQSKPPYAHRRWPIHQLPLTRTRL